MPAITPTGTLLASASVAVGTDGVTVGVVGVEPPLQSTSKYSQPVNSGVGERQLMRLFSVPLHSGTLSLTPVTAARVLYSPVYSKPIYMTETNVHSENANIALVND